MKLHQDKISHAILIYLLFGLIGLSCSKEVPTETINIDSYIHVLPLSGDQLCDHIIPTPADHGYMIIGCDATTPGYMFRYKLDQHFNKVSAFMDEIKFPNSKITKCPDGGYLLCSYGGNGYRDNMVKLDENGNMLFKSTFWPRPFINDDLGAFNGYPAYDNEGRVYGFWSAGMSRLALNHNGITTMSNSGDILGYIQIFDSLQGSMGKVLVLNPYKIYREPISRDLTFYYSTVGFVQKWKSWYEPQNICLSKVTYSITGAITHSSFHLIDSFDLDKSTSSFYQFYSSRNKLVMISDEGGVKNIPGVRIIQSNDSMEIEWQTYLQVDPLFPSLNNIIELKNGNYLLLGNCHTKDISSNQPLMVIMDPTGKVLFTKKFNMRGSAGFNSAYQINDNKLILTGSTTGFGNGNTEGDVYFLITDLQGNPL